MTAVQTISSSLVDAMLLKHMLNVFFDIACNQFVLRVPSNDIWEMHYFKKNLITEVFTASETLLE